MPIQRIDTNFLLVPDTTRTTTPAERAVSRLRTRDGVNMTVALAVGGYAVVVLIALVMAVRWVCRNDPGFRDDDSQDQ